MRASLPEREPAQVERWLEAGVLSQRIALNQKAGGARFLLHDGPPYANGSIHIGHVLNKVLKDIVVKRALLEGKVAEFIPGWDCHGLPIELAVEKQLKDAKKNKSDLSPLQLRNLCQDFAQSQVDRQRAEFQRMLVFADWDHPYLTMSSGYEAEIVRELGRCAEKGVLFKGNKPVYWCPTCQTALAEAEIEYAQHKSPSIWVGFEYAPDHFAVVWTTTPWTLPANLGIALHPDADYVTQAVEHNGKRQTWLLGKGLVPTVLAQTGAVAVGEPQQVDPRTFEKRTAQHPFIDRTSVFVLGEHVTQETGTGLVHTAPGHGADDYRVGQKYGLGVLAPVDARGLYTAEFPAMQGEHIFKANPKILAVLREKGALKGEATLEHSYPHCWRCRQPVIFRATPQWFIGMDPKDGRTRNLRKECLDEIDRVQWHPDWGINRIRGMIEARPDWCISRQRVWGVPIPAFYCEACEEAHLEPETVERVAKIFEKEGASSWSQRPASDFMASGISCRKCGGREFRKETDILDVWFESGVSHAAVCDARGLGWPADLYLEGSDQHRGWFQTSLITAVATRGRAPFKSVLTHGFVNDQSGHKMSKSKGNVVSPFDIIKKYGADILRLWVVLEDYRSDVNISQESLERVAESYRKIRNTLRFMLSNLYDFDPVRDRVGVADLKELDRWALSRVGRALSEVGESFDRYEYHSVYQAVINLCVVDLSSQYFDILKDRLYTAKASSPERRSSQTALYDIAAALCTTLAPILSFTAEEVFGQLPKPSATSVFLAEMSDTKAWIDPGMEERFAPIWATKEKVQAALEVERAARKIGHPREAWVTYSAPSDVLQGLRLVQEDLSRLMLVSRFDLEKSGTGEPSVAVRLATGTKCERCWVFSEAVGTSHAHPGLCDRCQTAVS